MDPAAESSAPLARPAVSEAKAFAPENFLLGGVLCLALATLVAYRLWDSAGADYFRSAGIHSSNRWLAAFGELGRPLALLWMLLLWAWAVKRPRLFVAGLLALALVMCTSLPLKALVGRIRPDQTAAQELKKPFYRRSSSFPSGDAETAFAGAAVACAFIAAGHGRWIPFLLAAIVALTRLCLLRHYLSDVCMGAAVGLLCGYFALRIASGKLSRAPPWLQWVAFPPRWWRPASGIVLILYLAGDALLRGPVTRHFLPVFAPLIVFVFAGEKGRAWLRWARGRARRR